MKFYVASRTKNRDLVKNIHDHLASLGHEVLSSWVDEENIIPYEENVEKAKARALQCIKHSGECDVFILISDNEGAGMYTELGAALMSNSVKTGPKIYIIGDYLNRSLFFFHPSVKRFTTIEKVLEDLAKQLPEN